MKQNGTPVSVKHYIGEFVYEGTQLKYFGQAEGRVVPVSGGSHAFPYEYFYRDHLGNTRMRFADLDEDGVAEVSEILQEWQELETKRSNSYPYGMVLEGLGTASVSPLHRFGFNGKELEDEFGLNWQDFGARRYDVQLGRWGGVDPLAEADMIYSPYNFVGGSPIRYLDYQGRFRIDAFFVEKYPFFAFFVANILPELKSDERFRNRLKGMGNLTDNEIDEILTFGTGPWITVTNNTEFSEYDFVSYPDNLLISQDPVWLLENQYVKYLNDGDMETLRYFMFRTGANIIHELGHYANYANRSYQEASRRERDWEQGVEMEKAYFGEQFSYLNNMPTGPNESVMQEFFQGGGLSRKNMPGTRIWLLYYYDYTKDPRKETKIKGQSGDPWLKKNKSKKNRYSPSPKYDPKDRKR